jgi:hypothetical protein
MCTSTLGLTLPPIKWLPSFIFPGGKTAEGVKLNADHCSMPKFTTGWAIPLLLYPPLWRGLEEFHLYLDFDKYSLPVGLPTSVRHTRNTHTHTHSAAVHRNLWRFMEVSINRNAVTFLNSSKLFKNIKSSSLQNKNLLEEHLTQYQCTVLADISHPSLINLICCSTSFIILLQFFMFYAFHLLYVDAC